jgi:multiple sugar transport system substrate-binding protein
LRRVIAQWNAAHPDQPVSYHELPTSPTLRHQALTQWADAKNGELTLTAMDYQWLAEFAQSGAIAAPKGLEAPEGTAEQAKRAASVDGELLALPFTLDAGVLYYRKDLLGQDAKLPTTVAELQDACLQVETLPLRKHPLSCYATPMAAGEDFTEVVLEAAAARGATILMPNGEPNKLMTARSIGLDWLRTWMRTSPSRMPTGAIDYSVETARDAFAAGKVVFYRDSASAWAALKDREAEGAKLTADQIGVLPLLGADVPSTSAPSPDVPSATVPSASDLPGTNVPDTNGLPGTNDQPDMEDQLDANAPAPSILGGTGLVFASAGQNLATARDFADWLTQPDRQRERYQATGALPVDTELLETLAAEGEPAATFASVLPTAVSRPSVPDYAKLSAALNEKLRPALASTESLEKAVSELKVKLSEIVAQR